MAISDKTAIPEGCPRNFHLFARLPAELRIKIWAYNLPGPRIIDIKCHTTCNQPTAYTSALPIPVNLHVCNESRLEALRRYQLLFGVSSGPPRIYVDPSRDILYFGRRLSTRRSLFNEFISSVRREDLACIRHIAISERFVVCTNNFDRIRPEELPVEGILCRIYQLLTGLKDLTIVCSDKNPLYSPDAVFVEPRLPNRVLERRVKDAINTVKNQPQFRPISWSFRAIATGPDCPIYDQTILGYEGSRASFWREVILPKYSRLLFVASHPIQP